MSTEMATRENNAGLLERVVVSGDLSRLSAQDRLIYYTKVCESVGLNPLTRPFDYLVLNNKTVLYAKRDATDQLRALHGVSITKLEREAVEGIYAVTAYAMNAKGRTDTALGAVPIEGLKGEAKANAMMKAETKAKRRVTLSLCGLGMLDETEVDSIPDAKRVSADGEVPATPSADEPPFEYEEPREAVIPAGPTNVCPECSKPALIKGKAEWGGGWVCKKRDGCGAKFRDGDPRIEGAPAQTTMDDVAPTQARGVEGVDDDSPEKHRAFYVQSIDTFLKKAGTTKAGAQVLFRRHLGTDQPGDFSKCDIAALKALYDHLGNG